MVMKCSICSRHTLFKAAAARFWYSKNLLGPSLAPLYFLDTKTTQSCLPFVVSSLHNFRPIMYHHSSLHTPQFCMHTLCDQHQDVVVALFCKPYVLHPRSMFSQHMTQVHSPSQSKIHLWLDSLVQGLPCPLYPFAKCL